MKIKVSIFILFCAVFLMIIAATCSDFGKSSKSTKGIVLADDDTVYFTNPNSKVISYTIPGAVFNAIDKRYIANRYLLTSENFYGGSKRVFELISFSDSFIPDYVAPSFANSLNSGDSWNYYINDDLLIYYSRVLVSTLMNHAIEKIEYIPNDTSKYAMKIIWDNKTSLKPYKEAVRDSVGAVRITTRNASSKINPDKSVLYLLNGIEINRKIFDAIKPVFIRSLQRITEKERLAEYKRKNLKEVVEIEVFKEGEVINMVVITTGDLSSDLSIVDDVALDYRLEYIFDINFFREHHKISEDNAGYSVYKEKYPDKKYFSIIVL